MTHKLIINTQLDSLFTGDAVPFKHVRYKFIIIFNIYLLPDW